MDRFKCYECGFLSIDQSKIKDHMQEVHSIKVGQEEEIARSHFCSLCSYKSKNTNDFKNHMITDHGKAKHDWWTETMKTEFYCDECDIEISQKDMFTDHIEKNHTGDGMIKSEHYKIEMIGGNSKVKDMRPGMEAFEDEKTQSEPTGMTMKGKSLAFKDACIKLKQQLVKGRMFKDSKGRKLTILEAPKGTGPIDVEVTTLSVKANEKRGNAKLMLHKPNIKKGATIQASLFSGSQFVFVKALMDMFVKPFVDSLMNDPDKSLMDLFKVTPHNKTIGKESMSVKVPLEFKCDLCVKNFPTNHGLSIHTGRVHKEENENKTPNIKRKRSEEVNTEEIAKKKINLKRIPEGISQCENCGGEFTYVRSYNWHMKNCNRRRKEFQESRVLTPGNKEEMKRIYNEVICKTCPECDKIIEAKDFRSLLEIMQSHNSICNIKIETKLADKTAIVDKDLEEMVKGVKELNVNDNKLESPKEVVNSCHWDQCSFKANKSLELKKTY